MSDLQTEYDKLFIGGKWTEPSTNEVIEVHCPATGEYVGKVPLAASHIEGRDGDTWLVRGQDGEVRAYREVVS